MLKNSEFGQSFSKMLGKMFKRLPVHPNTITLSSVLFALVAYLVFNINGWYSFALFLLAFFVDALDGAVARAKMLQTREGAFIDGICDRVVEFLLILVLFKAAIPNLIVPKETWLLITLFFGTGMTSYVKAYAEHSGLVSHAAAITMPGMLERAERSALLALVLLLSLIKSDYSAVVLLFTAVIALLTFIERFGRSLTLKD